MKITFYGAAQNVTGSKHLIETDQCRILLDCGLHQGRRSHAEQLNRHLPFQAKDVDVVVLSHAHLDHCGTLPVLIKNGYKGSIYATQATIDVAGFILRDSASIQEQDSDYVRRHVPNPVAPVEPLYTARDVEETMRHFVPIPYVRDSNQWTEIGPGVRCKLYDAGHILGSSIVCLAIQDKGVKKTLAFTGDLGGEHMPILRSPEYLQEEVQTMLMECTYGDRLHKPLSDAVRELEAVIREGMERGSKIIVPAFSLGRSQELIYILHQLTDQKLISRIPIYLDSPLAESLVGVYEEHAKEFDSKTWQDFGRRGENPFTFSNLHYLRTTQESKSLNAMKGPYMVISASGMAEGGRVRHHLKNGISDERNIVLFTGYQAVDTLGRKLLEGARQVNILGEAREVRARVISLDEFSAHADQNGLLKYLQNTHGVKDLFLVHTEASQSQAFAQKVHEVFPQIQVHTPTLGDHFEL